MRLCADLPAAARWSSFTRPRDAGVALDRGPPPGMSRVVSDDGTRARAPHRFRSVHRWPTIEPDEPTTSAPDGDPVPQDRLPNLGPGGDPATICQTDVGTDDGAWVDNARHRRRRPAAGYSPALFAHAADEHRAGTGAAGCARSACRPGRRRALAGTAPAGPRRASSRRSYRRTVGRPRPAASGMFRVRWRLRVPPGCGPARSVQAGTFPH